MSSSYDIEAVTVWPKILATKSQGFGHEVTRPRPFGQEVTGLILATKSQAFGQAVTGLILATKSQAGQRVTRVSESDCPQRAVTSRPFDIRTARRL